MKHFVPLFLILILFSCSNNNHEENEILDTIDTTTTQKISAKDTIEEPNLAVQENPLSIENFPKIWLKLDELNQEYIINQYCEAETRQLRILNEGEDWFVLVLYGQDSQRYKIIEFDAYEETRENFEIMYGSFVLENPDYADMDVELYDYMWNKDLMFCNFEGFFNEKTMMVSEKNKGNYETVKENCDYLQDNEE